jgi:hypothetical protein
MEIVVVERGRSGGDAEALGFEPLDDVFFTSNVQV